MGRKIFVSYKYADGQVEDLEPYSNSTVRDYVDVFENLLDSTDHIFKGEDNDDDLSGMDESEIWEKLKDKIFDSTITVVFISKGMRAENRKDKEQWIPWEVSFSLRTQKRKRQDGSTYTSHPNALIGVVLPDETGSYEYYYTQRNCCPSYCLTHHTDRLFKLLEQNMFNHLGGSRRQCDTINEAIWTDTAPSYIETVKWTDLLRNYNSYILRAISRQSNIVEYDTHINLEG